MSTNVYQAPKFDKINSSLMQYIRLKNIFDFFDTDLKLGISFWELRNVDRLSLFTELLSMYKNMHHEDKNLSGCRASQKLSVYMYMYIYVFFHVFIYVSSDNQLKFFFERFNICLYHSSFITDLYLRDFCFIFTL